MEMGAYDECLETIDYDKNGNEKIRLQYCTVYIGTRNDISVINLLRSAMRMTHPRVSRPCYTHTQFTNCPQSYNCARLNIFRYSNRKTN